MYPTANQINSYTNICFNTNTSSYTIIYMYMLVFAWLIVFCTDLP